MDSHHNGSGIWRFDKFIGESRDKLSNKQSCCQWLQTPWDPRDAIVMLFDDCYINPLRNPYIPPARTYNSNNSDVASVSWRFKSPATLSNGLFPLSAKETSKLHTSGSLWRESTEDLWIPLIKGQWNGKCFPVTTPSRETHTSVV